MVFSRETMKEIVEDYVKRTYGWDEVDVESFQQRKIHGAVMFETKLVPNKSTSLVPENDARDTADEA